LENLSEEGLKYFCNPSVTPIFYPWQLITSFNNLNQDNLIQAAWLAVSYHIIPALSSITPD
jgi:hypothetical protein